MNDTIKILFLAILLFGFACDRDDEHGGDKFDGDEHALNYPDSVYDFLAIPRNRKLSAASKRALLRNYAQGPEWYMEFKTHDLKGDFAYKEGVTRRDPSDIITVNGSYYVYYTKSKGITYGFGTGDPEKKVFPWDKSEIWFATSKDGWTWEEQGLAVGRGEAGSYDDWSLC